MKHYLLLPKPGNKMEEQPICILDRSLCCSPELGPQLNWTARSIGTLTTAGGHVGHPPPLIAPSFVICRVFEDGNVPDYSCTSCVPGR